MMGLAVDSPAATTSHAVVKDKARTRSEVGYVLGILLLALALRLYQLGRHSLWLDEGFSIGDSQHLTGFNRARPLYYLLLRFWMQFRMDEFWLRLPSVVFSVASIGLLYLIARRLAGARVACLASLLMTLAIGEMDHAQEVRMYTLATFLTLGSVYMLLRWVERPSWGLLSGHIVFAWLALVTTPATLFALLPAAGLALYAVRQNRQTLLALLTGYALLLLAWAPLALYARRMEQGLGGADRWLNCPTATDFFFLPYQLLLEYLVFSGQSLPTTLLVWGFQALLWLLVGAALVGAGESSPVRSGRLVAAWFFAALLAVFIISVLRTPIWSARYFQPIAPGLYLLLAIGWVRLAQRARPAARILGTVLLGTLLLALTRYYPKMLHEDWRGTAAWVQERAQPQDVICIIAPIAHNAAYNGETLLWRYYYHGAAPIQTLFANLHITDHADAKAVAALLEQIPAHSGRAWLVFRNDPRLIQAGLLPVLEAELRRRYVVGDTRTTEYMEAWGVAPRPKTVRR
ncbi:MAG TPA: glycosyltransferase family 39 protein [Chthonomonadaceae bacterium]|nr:glycosyltransferase family 39 protein [Chthonomonadaceae bacterium]